MLPVSAEVRAGARVAAGDELAVTLALDIEPREVEVPPDLAAALGDGEARRLFDGLSFSNRQRIALPIEGAKTAERRQRRIGQALAERQDGRAR
ncbi:MAG: hypothetical protein QOE87_968 [Gaiellales bacterium]|nr:hypothetical protein [Gaiellales bacterium]